MKRHYDSDATRKTIAEKAAQLFSQQGFAGTSISDISRASGFSKGHVYYHFENKEKLFVHLAEEGMRAWGEKWASVSAAYDASAADKLYAIARFVQHNYKTPLLKAGQELAANPSTDPGTLQALYGLAATPMQAYGDLFRQGIDSGEFEIEDLQAATYLFGTLLGALCQHVFTMEEEALAHLFRQSVAIFLRGISK
ncbi:TetR family transcriptional regulator C-terminal domain-containing protein [Cohnella nanjingensis]|uniref:TetR family transcriptional regulator n=1 Tax=Cohnella nanjingensis TaxID=1387779 RepID=A0A7X0VHI2_9BACL|nr:TetR/AcrR family transcriptional regulator [Cohnella nanjingensis]MBB6674182.1 TetR family transcriptional regulator [Cohnella nanjingensis]